MTPREADQLAQQCLPVVYEGIVYTRIVRVGYSYDEIGGKTPIVTLVDRNQNCIVGAPPARVEALELPGTVSRCKGCGAIMVWINTPAGKNMPCDVTPVKYRATPGGKGKIVTPAGDVVSCEISQMGEHDGLGYVPHWAKCPKAGSFKKEAKT